MIAVGRKDALVFKAESIKGKLSVSEYLYKLLHFIDDMLSVFIINRHFLQFIKPCFQIILVLFISNLTHSLDIACLIVHDSISSISFIKNIDIILYAKYTKYYGSVFTYLGILVFKQICKYRIIAA